MATADDEGESGEFEAAFGFHGDGVNVAFDVIDADEGELAGEADGFAVGHANEEGANEAGALGDGDGVEVLIGAAGLFHGLADDGGDGAEMLAGGEFGDDSAVFAVDIELGADDAGKDSAPVFDDGGGGFVTGGFDA